jgi:Fe2+ or Zn2+ uptake regulation protein
MQDDDVSAVLARAAKEAGFTISNATVEAEGLCGACRSAGAPHRTRRH